MSVSNDQIYAALLEIKQDIGHLQSSATANREYIGNVNAAFKVHTIDPEAHREMTRCGIHMADPEAHREMVHRGADNYKSWIALIISAISLALGWKMGQK